MSKALVIKGASFAQNAVDHITITEPIICTGITISESTITFTVFEDEVTITATPTPANTTEAITWASSDENVATVDNGVVKAVGIGTATITAYCGEQSASCVVNCASLSINFENYYKAENVRTDSNNNSHYITRYTLNYNFTYYANTNILGGYKAFYGNNDGYCIPVPKGSTYVSASSTKKSQWIELCTANTNEPSPASSGGAYSCYQFRHISKQGSFTNEPLAKDTIVGSVNTNGFVCSLGNTSGIPEDLNETLTVTFS